MQSSIRSLFSDHGDSLAKVSRPAAEAEELIETISPIIESHTAMVCPDCTSVCCIDRHSRFDYSDVIFMSALERDIPEEDPAVTGTDPCRFLGRRGCVRKRSERPYRCTWFFCSPLLEVIEERMPLAEYRSFMKMLRRITELRTEMIRYFEAVIVSLPPVPGNALKNK